MKMYVFCIYSVLFAAGSQYEKNIQQNPNIYLPKLLQLPEMFSAQKVPAVTQQIRKFYFGDKSIGRSTTQELIDVSNTTKPRISTCVAYFNIH